MLRSLVEFSLRFKGVVVVLSCVLCGYGMWVASRAKLDVFPEFVPPEVVAQTEAPGLTPEEVETRVTRPLENALNGLGNLEALRSETIQGLSVITVVFKEGTDVMAARQAVTERLTEAQGNLPVGVQAPRLEPMTSSTMDLLKIGFTSDQMSPMELRTFCDWTVKPKLLGVAGVAKCSVFGGEVREMQVQVDPGKLAVYDLSLQDVVAAARGSTGVRGAGFVETANQRILIQTEAPAPTAETLGQTVVETRDGKVIRLRDVGTVTVGGQVPVGDAIIMGKPGCLLTMSSQYGANTMEVTDSLEKALEELKPAFATKGVVYYAGLHRPASFISTSIGNVKSSLLLGGVLVCGILFLFLFNVRAAFISLTAIPLSLLAAIIVMDYLGFTLNTITLGGLAIAIGAVVDDAIIDVENIYRRLRENQHAKEPKSRFIVVLEASMEVRSAVVYATFVVILVFVPVLTLSGLEGKFFGPLAWAYIIATLASLLVALTVTPALALLLAPKGMAGDHEPAIQRVFKRWYHGSLGWFSRHAWLLIGSVALICVLVFATLPFFGGEFLPDFREGHFVVGLSSAPGGSLAESRRLGILLEQEFLKNPHIKTIEEQIGRAELGEDTWGPEKSELHINLAPMTGEEEEQTQQEIRDTLAKFPGLNAEVTTFLGDRIGESISGETAAVVVNIFGEDLDVLDAKAKEVAGVLKSINGSQDVQFESPQGPRVGVKLRPDRLTQFGYRADDVLEAVQIAYEGETANEISENGRTTDIVVLLSPATRHDVEAIGELPVSNAAGNRMRLSELAEVYNTNGRTSIRHEGARRRQTVTCNVAGIDDATFTTQAEQLIKDKVNLPEGYYIEVSGQAGAQKAARNELILHSAIAGVGILVLLAIVFGNVRNLLLLLVNMPFALVGGILAVIVTADARTLPPLGLIFTHPIDAMGQLHLGTLSIGALVGFVTLFGITTRNSIMMLSHFEHLVTAEGAKWGRETAMRGAAERLIPILMTALVTAIGLLPLALGSGEAGREIEGPMAVVILGGLATSTVLNLLVMPTLALKFGRFGVKTDA